MHSFVNDLERPVGTYLYGRRMYETMVYWETVQALADEPPCVRDFTKLWQAADKIVYSTSLETVSNAKTRIEREFDPRVIQEMKSSQERDITGWPQPGSAGFQGWARRRVPAFPDAHCRGRWQTITAQQRPPWPRTAQRAPFPQRRCLPPLSHLDG